MEPTCFVTFTALPFTDRSRLLFWSWEPTVFVSRPAASGRGNVIESHLVSTILSLLIIRRQLSHLALCRHRPVLRLLTVSRPRDDGYRRATEWVVIHRVVRHAAERRR